MAGLDTCTQRNRLLAREKHERHPKDIVNCSVVKPVSHAETISPENFYPRTYRVHHVFFCSSFLFYLGSCLSRCLPPSRRKSDPGGLIMQALLPPSPLRYAPFLVYREKNPDISSLSSTRISKNAVLSLYSWTVWACSWDRSFIISR